MPVNTELESLIDLSYYAMMQVSESQLWAGIPIKANNKTEFLGARQIGSERIKR